MMGINDSIDKYLNYVKTFKSVGTYKFYVINYKILKKYFIKNNFLYLNELDNHFFINFINDSRAIGQSNSTINKRIMCIKLLLKYFNVSCCSISPLKKNVVHFPCLDSYEFKIFNNFVDSLSNLSHKTFIKCFIDTGCRLNELIHIDLKNIDFRKRSILLTTTKTSIPRYVYFQESTKELILTYCRLNNIVQGLLFPFSARSIEQTFEKISNKIGFRVTSHILRHTFATRLVQNNIEAFSLQKLMGHSNISTTMIYVSENNEHVYNEYERCSKKY